MTDLPFPPLPADVDLRHLAYMPLMVGRLRDSDLASTGNPEAFRCAVLLWCAAWHQLPAGSLPSDDAVLTRLAGLGRDLKGWLGVREVALHGFRQFSDGRLYHAVVCEMAVDSWNKVSVHDWSRECDRIRKENKQRKESGADELGFPARPSQVSLDWPGEFPKNGDGIPPEGLQEVPPPAARILPEKRLKVREGKVREGKVREGKVREGKTEKKAAAASSSVSAREEMPDGSIPNWPVASAEVLEGLGLVPERPPISLEPVRPTLAPMPPLPPRTPGPITASAVPEEPKQPQQAAPPANTPADHAFRTYNVLAGMQGWPVAEILNSTRRFKLNHLLEIGGGMPGWTDVLQKASMAKFLQDPDGKPHRWVNLDWLLDEEHFIKVKELRYAERHVRVEYEPDDPNNPDANKRVRSVSAGLAGVLEEGNR